MPSREHPSAQQKPPSPAGRVSNGASCSVRAGSIFALLFGCWLGLALLKLGTPVILDGRIEAPRDLLEAVFQSWPISWGYWLLVPVVCAAIPVTRFHWAAPRWLLWLPAVWLAWQGISALQSVAPHLTQPTVTHFVSCVACSCLGAFALARARHLEWFWIPLLGAFLLMLAIGWHQHFVGLEETRRYFYEQMDWRRYPPEFLKKIGSNRIYATLFYPNALAGAILLLTPPALAVVWGSTRALHRAWLRFLAVALVGIAAVGCLVWSGSKSGWLIALAMLAGVVLHRRMLPRLRWLVLSALVGVGLLAFGVRYASYFAKGATSTVARMDYWRAAVRLAVERPVFGWGPGSFMVGYKRVKAPESEMTRLVHNDYLQQACDSGFPGAAAFLGFMAGALVVLYRRSNATSTLLRRSVLLACTALAVQSAVEFSLYIPALSWPFFTWLGWSLNQPAGNEIDSLHSPS